MTREEFMAAQEAMSRSTRRWLIGVFLVYMVVFFGFPLVLPDDARRQGWFEQWLFVVGGHPFTYGSICAVVMAWFVNGQPRRLRRG